MGAGGSLIEKGGLLQNLTTKRGACYRVRATELRKRAVKPQENRWPLSYGFSACFRGSATCMLDPPKKPAGRLLNRAFTVLCLVHATNSARFAGYHLLFNLNFQNFWLNGKYRYPGVTSHFTFAV